MNRFSPASQLSRARYPLGPLCLRVPVVQAPLGALSAGPRLCAEVSRAGALGTLTAHAPEPAAFSRTLARIRARTPRPVLVALTAEWESDAIPQIALDRGFCHFYTFWWNGARLAPRIKRAGGTLFWQIGSVREAQNALDAGADVLCVQGNEAGGQVRTPSPLRDLIGEIRAAFPNTPLVAGGGLASRADVKDVLERGASAAQMGTRFLLSEESTASHADKARLLRAADADLLVDSAPVGDWPCAPRRRLKTASDIVGLYAGLGVGNIRRVLPARALVRNLAPDSLAYQVNPCDKKG